MFFVLTQICFKLLLIFFGGGQPSDLYHPHQWIRFSQLHHQSRYLQEQAAKPFFASLAEIARRRPLLCLLENVLGLLRVWDQVSKALARLKPYGYTFAKEPFRISRKLLSVFNLTLFYFHSWVVYVHLLCMVIPVLGRLQ